MKKRMGWFVMAAILLALALVFLSRFLSPPFSAAEDEIALEIQLDVREDIGLLIIDYAAGDAECSGGVSNADKSPLKRDERLVFTIDRRHFADPAALENLRIRFRIITAYEPPNYENIYTPEHTMALEEIILRAEYGKTYQIIIRGGNAGGYQAVLAEPSPIP